MIEKFGGGPVGLNTIAASLSEEEDGIEEIYEPYLMQQGLLARTPRGRIATNAAYKMLGIREPRTGSWERNLSDIQPELPLEETSIDSLSGNPEDPIMKAKAGKAG